MRKHIGMVVLAVLVVVALLISMVAFSVDFTQKAVVQTFGRSSVVDGQKDAGLHFKLPPIQSTTVYDGRILVLEDPASEQPTMDKQNIIVSLFCAWRIADAAKFQASVPRGDVKAGEGRLREIIQSEKKNAIGKHAMDEFVNSDPKRMQIPQIEQEIFAGVRDKARDQYGVEVARMGIKSLALPESVTATVINAMKKERETDARKYESAGAALARDIENRADVASRQILDFAGAEAAMIRAEGVAAAADKYAEFGQNPELAMFLRSLDSLKKELSSRAVILLSGEELPAVRFFRNGPFTNVMPAGAPTTAPAPVSGQAKAPEGGK